MLLSVRNALEWALFFTVTCAAGIALGYWLTVGAMCITTLIGLSFVIWLRINKSDFSVVAAGKLMGKLTASVVVVFMILTAVVR